jgi:hypothetical protein
MQDSTSSEYRLRASPACGHTIFASPSPGTSAGNSQLSQINRSRRQLAQAGGVAVRLQNVGGDGGYARALSEPGASGGIFVLT